MALVQVDLADVRLGRHVLMHAPARGTQRTCGQGQRATFNNAQEIFLLAERYSNPAVAKVTAFKMYIQRCLNAPALLTGQAIIGCLILTVEPRS